MVAFQPKLIPTPGLNPLSRFSDDSRRIVQRTSDVSKGLGYSYIATHHLFYALLEHSIADPGEMFVGIDLPIFQLKDAMLRLDPPRQLSIAPGLKTTEATWNCYLWASEYQDSENPTVTPIALYFGFMRFRESVVDDILLESGLRISASFCLEVIV